VLRVPAREDSVSTLYPHIEKDRRYRIAAISGAALLGTGILIGGIVASPHFDDLAYRVPLDTYPARPEIVEVLAGRVDVEVVLTEKREDAVQSSGYLYGFGLPTNTLKGAWEYRELPVPALSFRVITRGWFPDIDGIARIEVPRSRVKKVVVRVDQGNIIVTGGAGRTDLPVLDLETKAGHVQRE
jgi:hypothetical protein